MIEITEALLLKLAGPRAYERGLSYFADDRVTAIESSERHTAATVHGTHPYTVQLTHTHSQLDGACDCPASEGIEFCKHCVALALVLQERQASGALLQTGSDEEKLKAYLALQTPEALVSELLNVLPKVPELRERLLLRAELAANSAPARRLKKAITQVTRPRQLWEYRQVAAYFKRIEATLQNIATIADELPAEVLLKTALYGIERLDKALEQVDDSGGYRFRAQESLRELHIKALRGLEWCPERRATHVLDLILEAPWDQFDDAPHNYADALGEEGLEAFYAQVEARLNALPEIRPGADFDEKYPYRRLSHYLKGRAVELEDWDALIRLEEPAATTARDYRRIAALYLRKQDPATAAEWLMKADALAGDDGGASASLWADVHAASRDWDAAVEAQRRVLRQNPHYPQYSRLIELSARAGRAEEMRNETKAWLRTGATRPWQDAQNAYTLAQILRDEEDWEGSYEALIGRVGDPEHLREAALWLGEPAPGRACELYAHAMEALIAKKNKRGYRAAVKFLLEAKRYFDATGPDEFAHFVARLRTTHRQKRNLIAALDAAL